MLIRLIVLFEAEEVRPKRVEVAAAAEDPYSPKARELAARVLFEARGLA
jgi:hypothetical protein